MKTDTIEEHLNKFTPVIYQDGKQFFRKVMNDYIVHPKGYYVLAPSGAGKTYFITKQKEKHWLNGDVIWIGSGAQPKTTWWAQGLEVICNVEQRSDVITYQARKLGLWIMGSSRFWLTPDAIVIPNWQTHKKYIYEREKDHYDGGVKSCDYKQVLFHRDHLRKLAKQKKVPIFTTVSEAAEYIKNQCYSATQKPLVY